MKIIVIDKQNQFRLIPDSALLLKHRPLFRPDYVQALHAKIALVVKINRLGKYIQEKFAPTYYDEVGFAINFYDKDCLDNQIRQGLPWERATCFDGSFALSEFMKISEISEKTELIISDNNSQLASLSSASLRFSILNSQFLKISPTIAYLSTHMTLKIGDYIALELDEIASAPFEINDVLRLSFNDKELIRVVIK